MTMLPPPTVIPPPPPTLAAPDFSWPTVLSFPKTARFFWRLVPGQWPRWAQALGYVAAVVAIAWAWQLMAYMYMFAWWVLVPYQLIRNGQRRKEYEARAHHYPRGTP